MRCVCRSWLWMLSLLLIEDGYRHGCATEVVFRSPSRHLFNQPQMGAVENNELPSTERATYHTLICSLFYWVELFISHLLNPFISASVFTSLVCLTSKSQVLPVEPTATDVNTVATRPHTTACDSAFAGSGLLRRTLTSRCNASIF